uniref:DNA-directed RNA polymerase subunit gamma n=2 Tax=Monsonia emarginata TaxID=28966 RepID=A0A0G2T3Y3_9ROSI|nr:RNA polymerase beta [Monsonia emarginata]AKF43443.1 RNA polymerase beta' subunit [Monsonia emarginata]AML26864.1 RNA polymerase beta [Monsonia emarginata]
MIDRSKHQQLRIGLVSPQQISAWANKTLPTGEIVGEVTKEFFFDFQTNKPERGGLFCERIFGPIKSGICACGNSRPIGDEKKEREFCTECGVEFVDSRIRRYQMGYIKLACPVAHVWYLKRLPSYIANLLDKSVKELEAIVYCGFSFARLTAKKPTFLRLRGTFEYTNQSWQSIIPLFFTTYGFDTFRNREIPTGAGGIREQLGDLDLRVIRDSSLEEWKKLKERGPTGNVSKDRKLETRKSFLLRRMGLAKHLIQTNIEPQWMVLCLLPVLPPELRPMFWLDEDKVMATDINILYRRVISRNNALLKLLRKRRRRRKINRIKKSRREQEDVDVLRSHERMVQEAVDILLDNGIRGQPLRDGNNRVYKSFTDVIQGKEGRFRETLLGKRVDYSGRSVIVVGPSLSLHQCGLPREIAIELFQPFVIRGLIRQHLAPNIGAAKTQIREEEGIVWEILQEVVQGHPVLLNRAPTLHRLGIQAFQPSLVEGRAICLHPLVCKGFNADFDGDQMAVHVPLSLEAQAEARLLMFSHMNLLAPSMGDPICVPTQDMLIGLYILTSGNRRGPCVNRYNPWNRRNFQTERIYDNSARSRNGKEPLFCNSYDAIGAYRQKRINLDSPFWLRWRPCQGLILSRGIPLEVHYESFGTHYEIYAYFLIVRSIKKKNEILCIYIRTTLGHIFLYREIEEAIQGFYQISPSGT